jgi:hypothetical protein
VFAFGPDALALLPPHLAHTCVPEGGMVAWMASAACQSSACTHTSSSAENVTMLGDTAAVFIDASTSSARAHSPARSHALTCLREMR